MKVNWDDEISNIWENKRHVPVTTNQSIIPPNSSTSIPQNPLALGGATLGLATTEAWFSSSDLVRKIGDMENRVRYFVIKSIVF